MEREELSPTAVILVRIASAFDLTLAGSLCALKAMAPKPGIAAADQPVWRDPATGCSRRQVFGRPDRPVEVIQVEMPAAKSVVLPASSYARIRQAVSVRSGELVITGDGDRHVLATGDCLGFGAPADTTFANETTSPCSCVVVLARS